MVSTFEHTSLVLVIWYISKISDQPGLGIGSFSKLSYQLGLGIGGNMDKAGLSLVLVLGPF